MEIIIFTILLFAGAICAGFLGALTGLGGGIVIVPLLTVVFGVDIKYAIGASLVSVIATSSGAASAYVKEGFSNMRIGMFLEMATTVGAIAGAAIALILNASVIAVIFGIVLLYSAYMSNKSKNDPLSGIEPDPLATRLKMNSSYPTTEGEKAYNVRKVPLGFSIMFVAGVLSGLLGIGSGAVKVLAMDNVMKIPFKVSTATSNFMIGVTAAASAGIYLHEGYVAPGIVMPVMLGVLIGSTIGAKLLFGTNTKKLRLVFTLIILALGIEMVYSGFMGNL
ncbi:MAG TPA: permease [Lentisphaeria bacterium]|nr:MAG: permease [Lentisphaerae bacterium GWF2_38_69]HBM17207.1 permease [Lentisphaeria bacterium]